MVLTAASSSQIILLGNPGASDERVKSWIIFKVAQLWQTNLFEVEMMSNERKLQITEQRPCVSDSDGEVCELDIVDVVV